jgi:hypothetical protein
MDRFLRILAGFQQAWFGHRPKPFQNSSGFYLVICQVLLLVSMLTQELMKENIVCQYQLSSASSFREVNFSKHF